MGVYPYVLWKCVASTFTIALGIQEAMSQQLVNEQGMPDAEWREHVSKDPRERRVTRGTSLEVRS